MLFILIVIFSLILQSFLPWWVIAVAALSASAWKAKNGGHAFSHSFLAIFLLWSIAGLIKTIPNENILANRVGEMLTLPFGEINWIAVLLITGILGGLVAGISGLTGYYLRGLWSR